MTTTPKTRKLLLNSGRAGVVYDEAGHTLGGGERVELDGPLDKVGKAAVKGGYLQVVEVPES
jgi:hypothetical protein